MIFLILLLLSTSVESERAATTKVTYEVSLGFPLAVMAIDEVHYGPCTLGSPDCSRSIRAVYPVNFFLNAIGCYLIIVLSGGLSRIARRRSRLPGRNT